MFKPGDEVVCVDARPCPEWEEWERRVRGSTLPFPLTEGETYHVRGLTAGGAGVTIVEVLSIPERNGVLHRGFRAGRFRKVQRRDIQSWIRQETSYDEEINNPVKRPAKEDERV